MPRTSLSRIQLCECPVLGTWVPISSVCVVTEWGWVTGKTSSKEGAQGTDSQWPPHRSTLQIVSSLCI